MKVLFLTQTGELGPSSRYRVYQLVPELERLGIECTVSPAIDDTLYRQIYLNGTASRSSALRTIWRCRKQDLRRAAQFDVVFIQKGVLLGLTARFERRLAAHKPVVFDFDDAIWLPREGGSFFARLMHRESAVRAVLRRAAAVIAGNEFLAAYARRFNPRVTVVPSAVDVRRYELNRNHEVIGWIGSRSTLPYLQMLKPVFARLGVMPRVVASGDPAILGFGVEFRPWRLSTELTELKEFGIGISPLPDTPWERGKCGVKVLQYMACGIPVVASPVGVQREFVEHGVTGFLAATADEWIEYLSLLLRKPELRLRLGRAGRQRVEQHYALPQAAAAVAAVLRSVC